MSCVGLADLQVGRRDGWEYPHVHPLFPGFPSSFQASALLLQRPGSTPFRTVSQDRCLRVCRKFQLLVPLPFPIVADLMEYLDVRRDSPLIGVGLGQTRCPHPPRHRAVAVTAAPPPDMGPSCTGEYGKPRRQGGSPHPRVLQNAPPLSPGSAMVPVSDHRSAAVGQGRCQGGRIGRRARAVRAPCE